MAVTDQRVTIGRRAWLQGATGLALSALASGCSGGEAALRVRLLNDSLPRQLIGEFRRTLASNSALEFRPESDLQAIADLLERWQAIAAGEVEPLPAWRRWVPFAGQPAAPQANLVTLGDTWLAAAIQAETIAPLELADLSNWSRLPARWQALVQRNARGELAPDGAIWGAPYRWGTTAIAYDREQFDQLGWQPRDWADLWRPELRERVAVVDRPREAIGFTLKKLGQSYNAPDLEAIPELAAELQALKSQVRLYNAVDYLQPLILKDVWVAVGWSRDLLAAANNYPQIGVVVPESGTALWADLWVRPAAASDRPLARDWIDFCWQDTAAQTISLFSDAVSPLLLALEREQLPDVLRSPSVLFPSAEVIERSEFLAPLAATTAAQYEALWRDLRQVTS